MAKLTTEVSKGRQSNLEMELEYWKSIKNSNDPDEIKLYLEEFPNGKFVSLAKLKIKKLMQKKVASPATPEVAKIEKPKEKAVAASISPDVSKPEIIARDGHYEKYANGVVFDTQTGLEWYTGPNKNMDLYDVKRWLESLEVDGGGWRMPTIKELKSLYKKGAGSRNMTSLLKTTGWYVWSEEAGGMSLLAGFDFYNGSKWVTVSSSPVGFRRGFVVRSRK